MPMIKLSALALALIFCASPEAIQNVFQLGLKDTPEIAGFNPLVMWDMHHLRAIDDSGYIDKLYQ
jgi:hypothetical protein